jgi:putative protease
MKRFALLTLKGVACKVVLAFPPLPMPVLAKTKKKGKIIGKVKHFYDNIGVGVLELKGTLKVGDTITIQRGEHEFTQTVESIQLEHESIAKAKKGQDVGLKLDERTKEGALVYKG